MLGATSSGFTLMACAESSGATLNVSIQFSASTFFLNAVYGYRFEATGRVSPRDITNLLGHSEVSFTMQT
jgi:hypothetical protein